jgi:hypothetical protein
MGPRVELADDENVYAIDEETTRTTDGSPVTASDSTFAGGKYWAVLWISEAAA